MASKKDKFLESAQRFVLKGQLDKAIKDYQQVVALDPKETRYRQKLAELLVRDNRKEEAIAHYEDIGKDYANNSYFLKAIAVYKQIQRLSPGNKAISLTLASLNHKQGLIGNAMAEYGQVVVQLEKEGNLKEAVKVLEQMLGVDARHAASRLKHAELLFALGSGDASCQTFDDLARSLRSAGDHAAAQNVSERMRQLFPGRREPDIDLQPASMSSALDLEGGLVQSYLQVAPKPELPEPSPALPELMELPPASAALETAAADAPSAFGAPYATEISGTSEASQGSPAPELDSPWEEEIELDLDGDQGDEDQSDRDRSDRDQSDRDRSHLNPAAAEVDLPLDFSLSLDFDEGEDFAPTPFSLSPDLPSETSPFDDPSASVETFSLAAPSPFEEASLEFPGDYSDEASGSWEPSPGEESLQDVAPLDLEEECPLELTFPDDDSDLFPEFDLTALPKLPILHRLPEVPESAAGPGPGQVTTPLRGWQEIYPDQGGCADAGVDPKELESNYDLGICYKEMGRYDEAIKQFSVAAGNPQRRLDCLTLQAICYREKGDSVKARELLQRGRDLEVLSVEERMSLSYELAFLLETTGAVADAVGLYREVYQVDPAFHDVARRLSALAGGEPLDIIELELEEGDF